LAQKLKREEKINKATKYNKKLVKFCWVLCVRVEDPPASNCCCCCCQLLAVVAVVAVVVIAACYLNVFKSHSE